MAALSSAAAAAAARQPWLDPWVRCSYGIPTTCALAQLPVVVLLYPWWSYPGTWGCSFALRPWGCSFALRPWLPWLPWLCTTRKLVYYPKLSGGSFS
jgi:hypothetical protein